MANMKKINTLFIASSILLVGCSESVTLNETQVAVETVKNNKNETTTVENNKSIKKTTSEINMSSENAGLISVGMLSTEVKSMLNDGSSLKDDWYLNQDGETLDGGSGYIEGSYEVDVDLTDVDKYEYVVLHIKDEKVTSVMRRKDLSKEVGQERYNEKKAYYSQVYGNPTSISEGEKKGVFKSTWEKNGNVIELSFIEYVGTELEAEAYISEIEENTSMK